MPEMTPLAMQALSVIDLSIDSIRLNPEQPRKYFDETKIDELSESIKQNGILEPVIVRVISDGVYELVAGERRFRAAVQAGLRCIPAIPRVLDDRQTLEIALIENIQREDINAVECALAYRRLMDDFCMTQEEVADRVGKKRSTIANTVRLLGLPIEILDSLDKGDISEGHARALLSIPDQRVQLRVWQKVISEGTSVRETERLSRNPGAYKADSANVARATKRSPSVDPNLSDVEDQLRRFLGTKVSLARQGDKGRIEIEFYDDEDLMRILDLIAQA